MNILRIFQNKLAVSILYAMDLLHICQFQTEDILNRFLWWVKRRDKHVKEPIQVTIRAKYQTWFQMQVENAVLSSILDKDGIPSLEILPEPKNGYLSPSWMRCIVANEDKAGILHLKNFAHMSISNRRHTETFFVMSEAQRSTCERTYTSYHSIEVSDRMSDTSGKGCIVINNGQGRNPSFRGTHRGKERLLIAILNTLYCCQYTTRPESYI